MIYDHMQIVSQSRSGACRHPDLSVRAAGALREMHDVVLDCLRGAIWSDHSSLHLLTKHRPRLLASSGHI